VFVTRGKERKRGENDSNTFKKPERGIQARHGGKIACGNVFLSVSPTCRENKPFQLSLGTVAAGKTSDETDEQLQAVMRASVVL
jgi:hypothetical protein